MVKVFAVVPMYEEAVAFFSSEEKANAFIAEKEASYKAMFGRSYGFIIDEQFCREGWAMLDKGRELWWEGEEPEDEE